MLGPDQVNHLARFLEQLAIGAKCRMPNAFLALPPVIFNLLTHLTSSKNSPQTSRG